MKTVIIVFCILMVNGLAGLSFAGLIDPTSGEVQLFKISPNPVSNYLEVKLNQGSLVQKDSAINKPLAIQVLILDQKGMMVYSSTKKMFNLAYLQAVS